MFINKVLEKAEKVTQVAPNLYQGWFFTGSLYIQTGEITRGVKALEKAHSLAPEEANILFNLGNGFFIFS